MRVQELVLLSALLLLSPTGCAGLPPHREKAASQANEAKGNSQIRQQTSDYMRIINNLRWDNHISVQNWQSSFPKCQIARAMNGISFTRI